MNVFALYIVMLCVITLSVLMLSVVILNVIVLSVVVLCISVPSVFVVNNISAFRSVQCCYGECYYAERRVAVNFDR